MPTGNNGLQNLQTDLGNYIYMKNIGITKVYNDKHFYTIYFIYFYGNTKRHRSIFLLSNRSTTTPYKIYYRVNDFHRTKSLIIKYYIMNNIAR